MLQSYLLNTYKKNEPIFLSDIKLEGVSETNLRQSFKVLTDRGVIQRYCNGVYYIPVPSRLKGSVWSLSADTVIEKKYLKNDTGVIGYYTGFTFANLIGLSTQVPSVRELVSNNASAIRREVHVGSSRLLLRKPRMEINKENNKILQFLDLLKDIEEYSELAKEETSSVLRGYMRSTGLEKNLFDKCLPLYPDRVYRRIYEMRLYDVFARR